MKLRISLLVVLLLSAVGFAKYSGGSGQPNDPYRIATPNDLNSIGLDPCDWSKYFLMTADINMVGFKGKQFNTIGYYVSSSDNNGFSGVFDGNEHLISGFVYDCNTENYVGLFSYINDANAEVKNICILDPNIHGRGCVGSLIGYLRYGVVKNCKINSGSAKGNQQLGGLIGCVHKGAVLDCSVTNTRIEAGSYRVGGLIGDSYGAVVSNCSSKCDVSGDTEVGGLVGKNDEYGIIIHCMASGTVTGQTNVGGLVGENGYWGLITESYAQTDVQGINVVGGLVGNNGWNIVKSWSTGSVVAGWICGGIAGYNLYGGSIENCYSSCSVQGSSSVGGLVGNVYGADIIECYSIGTVTGEHQAGGFAGSTGSSVLSGFWSLTTNPDVNGLGDGVDPNVIGLPTEQLKNRSTFTDAGWDMLDIWDIGENQTYPFLRMHLPSDINKDNQTNFLDLAILAQNWLKEQ